MFDQYLTRILYQRASFKKSSGRPLFDFIYVVHVLTRDKKLFSSRETSWGTGRRRAVLRRGSPSTVTRCTMPDRRKGAKIRAESAKKNRQARKGENEDVGDGEPALLMKISLSCCRGGCLQIC